MPDNSVTWSNYLEYASLSDVGLRRSNNQDSFAVAPAGDEQEWRERGHVFMVADGMGAHAAGELASKLAVNGVPHTYHKLLDRTAPEALRQAIIETNHQIHGRGEANAEFHRMGTTCSVLVLLPQGAMAGHVGDSRVYRLRRQKLEQLTFDHSLVWEMMANNQLPTGNAAKLVPKNIITRSLGPHPEVKVDLEGPFPVEVGDTFMLCSDGLSGQVTDEQIGVILGTLSPAEAARALVDLGNLHGGPDNITVIVVRVVKSLSVAAENQVFRVPASAQPRRTAPPAIWVTLGVALLISLGLAVTGSLIAAAACLGVAIVAGMLGLVRMYGGGSSEKSGGVSGPLGKGPYTARECVPSRNDLVDLNQLAQKLREAAVDQQWSVDWTKFNAMTKASEAADAAGQFDLAVREMALAISFMLNEIRHQRPKPAASDSNVLDI